MLNNQTHSQLIKATNQSVDQLDTQSVCKATNQSNNQPTNQSVDQHFISGPSHNGLMTRV